MKRLHCWITMLLIAVFAFPSAPVYAAHTATLQDKASQAMLKFEIMQKDKKGSLRWKDKTKRYEFITFVNIAMSYDVENDSAATDVDFKDLSSKHPAFLQIKAAAANSLISAYEDGTIRPDKAITTGDALVILLKALGYGEDLSSLDRKGILEFADKLGITGETPPKDTDPLTRGNAAIYIYRFLTIDFKKK